MKIVLVKVRRFPSWPLWSIVLVLCWLVLGGLATLGFGVNTGCSACWFKQFTTLPCPTCGFGRGMLSILGGNLFHGVLYNPLLFCFLAGWLFHLVARLLFCKSLRLVLSSGERVEFFGLTFLVFFANWIYLIMVIK